MFFRLRSPDPHSFALASIVYRHSIATHLAFCDRWSGGAGKFLFLSVKGRLVVRVWSRKR